VRTKMALVLVLLLVVASCEDAVGRPPEILLGADGCDYCRMVISEERHAAAIVAGEQVARFDDPGCLLAWLDERDRGEGAIWVHDEQRTWRKVEDVWFAIDPEGGTPMASGILAFSSEEAASRASAVSGAEALRFEALADRLPGGSLAVQSKSLVEK